jgi:hypothetical protein
MENRPHHANDATPNDMAQAHEFGAFDALGHRLHRELREQTLLSFAFHRTLSISLILK